MLGGGGAKGAGGRGEEEGEAMAGEGGEDGGDREEEGGGEGKDLAGGRFGGDGVGEEGTAEGEGVVVGEGEVQAAPMVVVGLVWERFESGVSEEAEVFIVEAVEEEVDGGGERVDETEEEEGEKQRRHGMEKS